jgi:ubiquinone/menaquinone biosynthesis C-methylase UbiE
MSDIPPELLSLLRDPVDHLQLTRVGDVLENRAARRSYPIVDSIPVLLDTSDLGQQNLKMQKMYEWMSVGFDFADWLGNFFLRGGLHQFRRLFAERLGLRPGFRCLYTSIGTGGDLPFLAERCPLGELEIVGLDLTMGMLRQCRKKLRDFRKSTLLVQANAECLPFADRSFDVVFHIGGINLFDRPTLAVEEMARVAKPGSLILIADETKTVIQENYQKKNLLTRSATKGMSADFNPLEWVPEGSVDTALEEVWNGKAYLLSFRTL